MKTVAIHRKWGFTVQFWTGRHLRRSSAWQTLTGPSCASFLLPAAPFGALVPVAWVAMRGNISSLGKGGNR